VLPYTRCRVVRKRPTLYRPPSIELQGRPTQRLAAAKSSRPTLYLRRASAEPGLPCPVPRRRIPPYQTGTAPPRPLTTRPVLPTLRPWREPTPPQGVPAAPPRRPSGARRGPPTPGATPAPPFIFRKNTLRACRSTSPTGLPYTRPPATEAQGSLDRPTL